MIGQRPRTIGFEVQNPAFENKSVSEKPTQEPKALLPLFTSDLTIKHEEIKPPSFDEEIAYLKNPKTFSLGFTKAKNLLDKKDLSNENLKNLETAAKNARAAMNDGVWNALKKVFSFMHREKANIANQHVDDILKKIGGYKQTGIDSQVTPQVIHINEGHSGDASELVELKEKHEKLQEKLEESLEERNRLGEENQSLQKEISRLKKEQEELPVEKQRKLPQTPQKKDTAETDQLNQKIKDLEKELEKNKSSLTTAQSANERHSQENAELVKTNKTQEKSIADLEKQLIKEKEYKQSELKNLQKELKAQSQYLKEYEAQHNQLAPENLKLKKQVSKLEQQLAELTQNLQSTQEGMATKVMQRLAGMKPEDVLQILENFRKKQEEE